MENQNIKIYLAISGAVIVLFILILVIPFSKRSSTQNNSDGSTNSTDQPFPTSIDIYPTTSFDKESETIPANFTGVAEEELPPQILEKSLEKKELRENTPLDLSAFMIDFDYNTDKFLVTLKDPKDQSQKEFDSWRTANYPALGTDQFLLK
jgi:hypothetical protein